MSWTCRHRAYFFLLNHTAEAVEVELPNAVDGVELLTGAGVSESVRLDPHGVAVCRLES